MEDQAESLRRLMREKKLKHEKQVIDQDKEAIKELEQKANVTDDKVEALAERILAALTHKDTQAEDLFKTVLKRDIKDLTHIEHLNRKIHERLEAKLREYSHEEATYIKELIKEIQRND